MSEKTHQTFDDEVRRLLDQAEERARETVQRNRAVLDGLVARLLERETLEGRPLAEALARATGSPAPERCGPRCSSSRSAAAGRSGRGARPGTTRPRRRARAAPTPCCRRTPG